MKAAKARRSRDEIFPAQAGSTYLIMRGPGGEAFFRDSGGPHERIRYEVPSETKLRVHLPNAVRKHLRTKVHPVIDLPEEFIATVKNDPSQGFSLVTENGSVLDPRELASRGVTVLVGATLPTKCSS